jgi:uncharacterized protein
MAVEGGLSRWPPPQVGALTGNRLHLQHGPIDLVIRATGADSDIACAYAAARERFQNILGELVGELPLLRRPLEEEYPPFAEGPVARRMIAACWPHRAVYITPMAAVAGSVADELKAAMRSAAPHLRTLYVNNGGDIAVHVAAGATLRIGLVAHLAKAAPDGVATILAESGIGGIATSGWRGRSFSLGVADAVTVLARTAADADAAATIVANAVAVDGPAVRCAPARTLDPDSDLGGLDVTTYVGPLNASDRASAIASGLMVARTLQERGLIQGALVALQGEVAMLTGSAALEAQIDGKPHRSHSPPRHG